MIVDKGNVGIGIRTPASKLDLNGGMRIRGKNSVSSVHGFQNSLELLTPGSAALVFQPGTSGELMFGFHTNGNFYWGTGKSADNKYSMILNRDGYLEVKGSIGGAPTSSSSVHKLTVEGSIGVREVNVKTGAWPDFVFEPEYKLMDLSELEAYIVENKHLPQIPTEKEVLDKGQNIGEINRVLLQKIEELTLYIIQQDKKIDTLQDANSLLIELAEKVARLENKQ